MHVYTSHRTAYQHTYHFARELAHTCTVKSSLRANWLVCTASATSSAAVAASSAAAAAVAVAAAPLSGLLLRADRKTLQSALSVLRLLPLQLLIGSATINAAIASRAAAATACSQTLPTTQQQYHHLPVYGSVSFSLSCIKTLQLCLLMQVQYSIPALSLQ